MTRYQTASLIIAIGIGLMALGSHISGLWRFPWEPELCVATITRNFVTETRIGVFSRAPEGLKCEFDPPIDLSPGDTASWRNP